jgi:hypothetical protein
MNFIPASARRRRRGEEEGEGQQAFFFSTNVHACDATVRCEGTAWMSTSRRRASEREREGGRASAG